MAVREHDVKVAGIKIHCYEGGKGYPILMLHGSGPGASSVGNWVKVMGPLSRRYHVLAGDLIGFGQSGQKERQPYFDVDLWTRQGEALLNRVAKRGKVGIIGHSLSGYLALRIAAGNPRVDKVLVTGSLGAKYKIGRSWRSAGRSREANGRFSISTAAWSRTRRSLPRSSSRTA